MISSKTEKDLLNKYENAVRREFYLEGIAIIFHLLELRTRSVITVFAGCEPGNRVKIKKSILRIKKNRKKVPSLIKHFSNSLFKEVLDWKEARDYLMHQLVNDDLEEINVDDVASNGLAVYRKFAVAHDAWLKNFEFENRF